MGPYASDNRPYGLAALFFGKQPAFAQRACSQCAEITVGTREVDTAVIGGADRRGLWPAPDRIADLLEQVLQHWAAVLEPVRIEGLVSDTALHLRMFFIMDQIGCLGHPARSIQSRHQIEHLRASWLNA